ncbi:MAG TPA: glucose-6-phosphate dehydrogenase assembly protein OpcA [Miltoncostaeaceae bacterium]|nr:glucose-6-phosphate dehydrogenase assembly protein OpcA [Miltoncostaeaceae bacterium]
MATAVAGAPSSARWSGEGVRIGEVAARLADLRHGLAPEGAVPARTSVLNLIAWAPDEAAAAEMEDVVDHLADHHPSRAVILTTAPGGDGIDAQAEAAVRRATDGRPVEVERVVLTLRGGVVEHAASAVIPLLRSDLTTFLWWPGRPDAAHPVMRDLGGVADRVVTEAARDADGPEAAAALADLAGADGPAVTDLAWAEVTAWRQTVALTIRGAVLRSLQEGNAAIRVAGGGDAPSLEALLVAGWLAGLVGPHARVAVEARSGEAGGLCAIELDGDAGEVCAIVRAEGASSVAIRTRSGERSLPVPVPSRPALLAGELELRSHDRPFERAVRRAAAIAAG